MEREKWGRDCSVSIKEKKQNNLFIVLLFQCARVALHSSVQP